MTQSNLALTENQVIPEGYKKTEIGIIPEDWIVEPLEKFTTFISYGFTNPMPTTVKGPYMLTAKDINGGKIQYREARQTSIDAFNKLLTSKSKPIKNDLLLTKDGTLGRLALVEDEPVCINQSVAVLRPNQRIVPKFFQLLLESEYYQDQMLENAGGSTIKHIYITVVNKMLLGLPQSLVEQQKIATALSDTDALISELEKLIEKKQAIKTATMQQLLTGKTRLPEFSLREDGTPKAYKDSELGQIPEDWDIKSFGEIFKFLSTANNARDDLSEEGDYSYIHYGDIHTKFDECIDCEKVSFPKIDKEKVSSVFLKSGDLIMADASEDYAGIGKSIEVINVNTKIVAGLHTFLLRDENQYYINGFKAYLHLIPKVKKSMDRLATGLKVYSLSKTVLKTILLPVPLKEEQSAIVAFLNDMNLDIDISEQKLEKLKLIKQGMMQELLTGKIRLV